MHIMYHIFFLLRIYRVRRNCADVLIPDVFVSIMIYEFTYCEEAARWLPANTFSLPKKEWLKYFMSLDILRDKVSNCALTYLRWIHGAK